MVFCEIETVSSNVHMHLGEGKIQPIVIFLLKINYRQHSAEWTSEWRSTERF